jgi:hypothetical protein
MSKTAQIKRQQNREADWLAKTTNPKGWNK